MPKSSKNSHLLTRLYHTTEGKFIEIGLTILLGGISFSYLWLLDILEQYLDTWAAHVTLLATITTLGICIASFFIKKKKHRIVILAAAIALVIIAGGLVGYNIHTRSLPLKTLVVVIANLDDKANEHLLTEENIAAQLAPYATEISVIPVAKEFTNQQEAQKEGKKKRATIVLWGKYAYQGNAREQAEVHVEILNNATAEAGLKQAAKGELLSRSVSEENNFVLQTDLKKNIAYVSLIVLGLAKVQTAQWDAAIAKFQQALNELPSDSAFIDQSTIYRNLGLAYYKKQNHSEAIKNFSEAIKQDPSEPVVWYNRGVSYYETNQYDKAYSDYTKAIELDPQYADAYNNRGVLASHQNKPEQAIRDFNQAIRLEPSDDLGYFNRAGNYMKLGNAKQALADYNKAIELNPNRPNNYSARGTVYSNTEQLELAIKDFTEALNHNPPVSVQKNIYFLRANTYRHMNKEKLALADFEKVLRLDPKDAYMYDVISGMYSLSGNTDKAIEYATRAIQLAPTDARPYASRGNYYFAKKEYDKGLADYTKAMQLDPTIPGPYNGRGTYYEYIKGDKQAALADFQKAYELYSIMLSKEENPTIRKYLQTLMTGTQAFIDRVRNPSGTISN